MSYARTNHSTTATIDNKLFGSGTFKYVYAGTYTSGPRKGHRCVSKEFKSGCVVEEHYFQEELNICDKAQKIIDEFNEEEIISQEIHLNTPEVWTYVPGCHKSGQKSLIEPMILNFEKFNSNSGWALTDSTGWASVMQALSHFSYHNSGGQLLLCDLQGGRYKDGYVLTDPVIMSRAQNRGPADLGSDGITSFFQRHRCGPFCDKSWSKPRVVGKAKIPMNEGTTMQAYLKTRNSRVPLSRLGSVLE
ncbi:hypothetical protein TWF730_000218 [Orbilia blumenaviensis]|uniref:Alpha-type protein kinase domain-containing protein n=1 Tax=Orbilia blumenaviensis TaxID=1796055 RepID=A0AAV9VN65_9PEZI